MMLSILVIALYQLICLLVRSSSSGELCNSVSMNFWAVTAIISVYSGISSLEQAWWFLLSMVSSTVTTPCSDRERCSGDSYMFRTIAWLTLWQSMVLLTLRDNAPKVDELFRVDIMTCGFWSSILGITQREKLASRYCKTRTDDCSYFTKYCGLAMPPVELRLH